MPRETKAQERARVWERIRAHLRKHMHGKRLGLTKAGKLLHEDKSALSYYLIDRAPSAFLIYRMQVVFDLTPKELLNDDPDAKWFVQGAETFTERPDAPETAPPSPRPAPRAPAAVRPGKRRA